MSNGAMMAQRLGCELASKIAAIAPVEGTLLIPACTPTRPVPVYEIHGALDLNVPYNGGFGCSNNSVRKVADAR